MLLSESFSRSLQCFLRRAFRYDKVIGHRGELTFLALPLCLFYIRFHSTVDTAPQFFCL